MTGILTPVILIYVLYKIDAPWWLKLILTTCLIVDTIVGAYGAGKRDKDE